MRDDFDAQYEAMSNLALEIAYLCLHGEKVEAPLLLDFSSSLRACYSTLADMGLLRPNHAMLHTKGYGPVSVERGDDGEIRVFLHTRDMLYPDDCGLEDQCRIGEAIAAMNAAASL